MDGSHRGYDSRVHDIQEEKLNGMQSDEILKKEVRGVKKSEIFRGRAAYDNWEPAAVILLFIGRPF
jgi:hypothetical protein